jgi:hypothetical protein
MTDEREEQVKQMFLTGVNLQRTLASFCSDACGATDPIVQTVLSVLASPVQLQLTRVGLQMFQVWRDWPDSPDSPDKPVDRARTSRSRFTGWSRRSARF